jgi:hypothetical protein
MAAKFGARGKTCSIVFVMSIINANEPCAVLKSLTRFATKFYLSAALSALPFSSSTNITIANFFD